MTHTAEEVRANVAENRRHMTTATEAQLTAYAALLERREAGVTAEVTNAAKDEFAAWMSLEDEEREDAQFDVAMQHALKAVWPVAAEPAQPADSGRVGETRASAFNTWWDSEEDRSKTTRATLAWSAWNAALAAQGQPAERTPDAQAMVNRFLGWRLPKDFAPDCGISFDGRKDDQWNTNKTWPIGTNLFTAAQAEQMFRYVLDTPQPATQMRVPDGWRATHDNHTRMWTVHTPSGDSIGIYDQAAGIANVVLRQLAQHLAAPQPGESAQESQSNG